MPSSLKRLLIGRPIATERAHDEKLRKLLALPIFASDALSSVAYASEEIMAALLVAGVFTASGFKTFTLTPWLSLAIIVLLAIVVTSYRQIVMAYPNGGGAYIVAKDNLGEVPAQTAGAALLVDYILTVAVSVSAGVAALKSLVQTNFAQFSHHELDPYTVPVCVLAIVLIAVVNLRGVKESGAVFAVPAYSFIALMYVLIGVGLFYYSRHSLPQMHSDAVMRTAQAFNEASNKPEVGVFGLFLILHAFASGCTALTGVEAISNGVQAFKPPESKNAAITMAILGGLLGTIFLGLSFLAVQANALPPTAVFEGAGQETVLSQVGRAVFGTGALYWILQIVTAIILILAANTSFAGFPRLCALQAQDGFLPKQLSNIGDRLVYDNGIKILAAFSIILVAVFKGDVHSLLPLYAIGVFLSFTLSQGGMVKRWLRLKTPGWQMKAAINGFGTICTFVVLCIFGIVKFEHGAWVVIIIIPALIMLFFRIKNHYRSVSKQLSLENYRPAQGMRNHVYVLVPDIHRGVIPALQYARSISEDTKAIHISIDPTREARLRERWTLYSRGVPLTILDSPYRSLADPIEDFINQIQEREPNAIVTLVVPEFLPTGVFAKLLHGQAALLLNVKLHQKPGVIIITVPYHIEAFVKLERGYDSSHFRAEDRVRGRLTSPDAQQTTSDVAAAHIQGH